MPVIQFESIVEGNLIRVPDEYADEIHSGAKVTVRSYNDQKHIRVRRAEAGALLPGDFSAFKVDTREFKFNRDEANER